MLLRSQVGTTPLPCTANPNRLMPSAQVFFPFFPAVIWSFISSEFSLLVHPQDFSVSISCPFFVSPPPPQLQQMANIVDDITPEQLEMAKNQYLSMVSLSGGEAYIPPCRVRSRDTRTVCRLGFIVGPTKLVTYYQPHQKKLTCWCFAHIRRGTNIPPCRMRSNATSTVRLLCFVIRHSKLVKHHQHPPKHLLFGGVLHTSENAQDQVQKSTGSFPHPSPPCTPPPTTYT